MAGRLDKREDADGHEGSWIGTQDLKRWRLWLVARYRDDPVMYCSIEEWRTLWKEIGEVWMGRHCPALGEGTTSPDDDDDIYIRSAVNTENIPGPVKIEKQTIYIFARAKS